MRLRITLFIGLIAAVTPLLTATLLTGCSPDSSTAQSTSEPSSESHILASTADAWRLLLLDDREPAERFTALRKTLDCTYNEFASIRHAPTPDSDGGTQSADHILFPDIWTAEAVADDHAMQQVQENMDALLDWSADNLSPADLAWLLAQLDALCISMIRSLDPETSKKPFWFAVSFRSDLLTRLHDVMKSSSARLHNLTEQAVFRCRDHHENLIDTHAHKGAANWRNARPLAVR